MYGRLREGQAKGLEMETRVRLVEGESKGRGSGEKGDIIGGERGKGVRVGGDQK